MLKVVLLQKTYSTGLLCWDPGTVRNTIFVGSQLQCEIEVGRSMIRGKMPSWSEVEVGQSVSIDSSWPGASVVWMKMKTDLFPASSKLENSLSQITSSLIVHIILLASPFPLGSLWEVKICSMPSVAMAFTELLAVGCEQSWLISLTHGLLPSLRIPGEWPSPPPLLEIDTPSLYGNQSSL